MFQLCSCNTVLTVTFDLFTGLRAQFGVLDQVNMPEKKVILSPCQTNPMPKVRDAVSEAPGRFNLDAQRAFNSWGRTTQWHNIPCKNS
jgi:hypothetical protein